MLGNIGFLRNEANDRINVKLGIWRIFIVLLIGIGYSVIYHFNSKWLLFWLFMLIYAGLWLLILGKYTNDKPNIWIYIFAIGDVAFFIYALSFEHDLLTNYSALLILPLFQYMFRYGRIAAAFYTAVSFLAIIYICIFHYSYHPLHHFIIIIIMLLITFNEGFLIEENNALRKQLYNMVIYDELTGLYNYRYFCESMEKEYSLAKRLNKSLTLIIIDVDNFKMINDNYGHETGNEVIRKITNIIKENIRDYDYACRYGGEEFALILPHTEVETGVLVAERIRQKIYNYNFSTGKVTVSIGMAAFPLHSSLKDNLIVNADKALYISKKNGKNRVSIYTT